MKVWIIIVYSISVGHMSLETVEFSTLDACNNAKQTILSTKAIRENMPVTTGFSIECIGDTREIYQK